MEAAIHILDGIGGVIRTFTDVQVLVAELAPEGAISTFPANDNSHPELGTDVEMIAALAGYSCRRIAGPGSIGRPGDWIWWLEASG